MARIIRAFAPATVANVGPGFDVLGFALREPGDVVEVRRRKEPGVSITWIDSSFPLPVDVRRNTAGIAVRAMLEALRIRGGVEMMLRKRIPLGSGMGGSAASSVAAAVAANALFGEPFEPRELLPFIQAGERAVSGWGHLDNASASLLGGLILIRSYEPLEVIRLPLDGWPLVVMVHPNMELRTVLARKVLRKEIPLRAVVRQMGHMGAMMVGLMRRDAGLVGRAMEDFIVEPRRARLIPGFPDVKAAALKHGALGCTISGGGPSVFAFVRSRAVAERVGGAMRRAFARHGMGSTMFVSTISRQGARVLR
jgi:homoserine kinase